MSAKANDPPAATHAVAEPMKIDEWRRAVTSAVQELGFSEEVQAAFLAAVFECHEAYHGKWAALEAEVARLRQDIATPELPPPRCYALEREGGKWLGDARSWVQRKKRNGEFVTWGSGDVLQPPMTIREVEEVAAEAAAGALRDRWEAREQLRVVRERRFHREAELLGRAERAEAEVERLRQELKR